MNHEYTHTHTLAYRNGTRSTYENPHEAKVVKCSMSSKVLFLYFFYFSISKGIFEGFFCFVIFCSRNLYLPCMKHIRKMCWHPFQEPTSELCHIDIYLYISEVCRIDICMYVWVSWAVRSQSSLRKGQLAIKAASSQAIDIYIYTFRIY